MKTKEIPDDSLSINTFYEIEEVLIKNLIGNIFISIKNLFLFI
jgi:hypothetical protein